MALFAGIELCAGVGMLGEGVRAAFGFLGHEYRTVCYVEREAAAAGQLATLMEAGIIDSAPVWSDMLTFDGAAWCGKVDCIIAGFPCQDLSIAGRRAGLDGKRSGLFFRVCDIADDCDAQYLLLENVSAIASATATVMDEAEGELEERAAARVMGELADRGWDSEWITISASEVGASHRRARWFCFAWRVANPERAERRQERIDRSRGSQGHDGSREANGGTGIAIEALADPGSEGRQRSEQRRTRIDNRGGQEAHGPTSELCDALGIFAPGPNDTRWPDIIEQLPWLAPALPGASGENILNPRFVEWLMGVPIGWTEELNGSTEDACIANIQVGNSQTRATRSISVWREMLHLRLNEIFRPASQGLSKPRRCADFMQEVSSRGRQEGRNLVNEFRKECNLRNLSFDIYAGQKSECEAVQKPGMPEGTWASECEKAMGNRIHRLRALGNGVVPLQAATAFVTLMRRAFGAT